MTHAGVPGIETAPPKPPLQMDVIRFVKRTCAATLITLGLVAMTAAVYGQPRWAGYYLASGFWSLVYLALLPLILKAFMFDRRPGRGLVLVGLKLAWLVVLLAGYGFVSRGGARGLGLALAVLLGATTPILVIMLRVLGGALNPKTTDANQTTEGKP